jgi:hypothetical protein
MELFLAREAMDPHLKRMSALLSPKTSIADKIKCLGSAALFYSLWVPKQLIGGLTNRSFSGLQSLACHYKFIKTMSHRLARGIFCGMIRHRQGLEKKQLLLSRLMAIGTDLFAMAAACSYAVSLDKEKREGAIELADYFCKIATRRIHHKFHEMRHNDDKPTNKLAEKVIGKNYRWLEKGIIWIGPND